MAEPDDAFARASAEISALKRVKPKTAAEGRARAVELVRLNEILTTAARKVTDANAAKRLNGGSAPANGGNDNAPAGVLTEEYLPALAKAIGMHVREEIAEAMAPLVARIAELEQRPSSLPYEGTWSASKAYACGCLVTHQGSLWHCEDPNMGVRPGSGSLAWKLAVKKGHGG